MTTLPDLFHRRLLQHHQLLLIHFLGKTHRQPCLIRRRVENRLSSSVTILFQSRLCSELNEI